MVLLRSALLALALTALLIPAAAAATRPTQPGEDVYGNPNYQVAEETPYCLTNVCVHWVAATDDKPADPDGIPLIASGAQHAYEHMASLGWRPPVPDGARGGGTDLVDIYVKKLNGQSAGVAVRDDDSATQPSGFVLLAPGFVSQTNGFGQRKVAPHEIQHLVEYAYDSYFESWNAESTSEWAAAQTDGSYDILRISNYVNAWAEATEFPMVAGYGADGHPPPKAYVDVMWQRWLSDRYGNDMVRDVWERTAAHAPGAFAPLAIEEALAGRSTFFDEFVASSVAAAEWRAAGSGFAQWDPATMPDVERVATLQPGGDAQAAQLDHTAFALLDVPVGDAQSYELRATAPSGVRSAVALVGRRGDGTVDKVVQALPSGGEAHLGLADPARYERITAVLVNADTAIQEPYRNGFGGWIYAHDDEPYTARIVKADRPPPPPVDAGSPKVAEPPKELPPPVVPPVLDNLVAPHVTLGRLGRGALRRLRAGRPVRLRVSVDERSAVAARVVVGNALTVVERRSAARAAGSRTLTLRATRRARRRLARVRRAQLVVTARDAAGNVRTLRRALRG
ncbi:MAG TPA: hypothetical protein VF549_02990 [Solirubrobacteraceae bacterium]